MIRASVVYETIKMFSTTFLFGVEVSCNTDQVSTFVDTAGSVGKTEVQVEVI